MINRYLLKFFLVLISLTALTRAANAQYAIGGSAGTNLVNSVYWLTWNRSDPNSTLVTAPAGSNASNIVNGTYVWQFSPTVRITAVITNLVTTGGGAMQAYTPGSYSGDGLDLIYSGNNLAKPDSRGVANSGLATPYGGTAKFDIDVKVAILINNVWTNVDYPGMIIADAESIDAGGEYITADTPNPIAWQLLNKRTQNRDADDEYKLELSNSGRSFRLYANLLPGNFGVQAVMFAHNAQKLNNVGMKGSGLTAMAIGFVLPFDLGDDPASYGTTGNYMEQFQITDYFAGDGTYAVVNYNTTPLVAKATVYLGADNVDPDGEPEGTANADTDEKTGNNDENSISPAALPQVKVNQAGDIVINVTATNTKSTQATLRGWIDFNNDGVFGADEQVGITVPGNTANKQFTLTYPNAYFRNKIKAGPLYMRLRITTNNLIDDAATDVDERSRSFASDGESEDYRLKDVLGITISGRVVNDGDGAANGTISGTGIQAVAGKPLYAYLVNSAGKVVVKDTVKANGNYSFANVNNGNYTVALSTNSVDSTATLADVAANLPSSWKPSGEFYGQNNAGNTGIEPGTPNAQITVSTPGTSLDITNINFGLNQVPVATNDTGTTTAGKAITLNIPANDKDNDGTLDLTSVRLIDPVDNTAKTSVTIAGQGTYAVNATTGRVTFTPLPAFAGNAIPIEYTIKDNLGAESPRATIAIVVKPDGVNDQDVTGVGVPVTTTVKANDGAEALPAGVTVTAGQGAHGKTTVDATGKVTYTPEGTFAGTDTYTYVLTTADGVASDPITVTINIKPVGVNDATVTPINTPVTTTVLSNDGPSGTGATVTPTNGAHGTTTVDATGKVTYKPDNNYIGKDTYTYTITKNGVTSDPITVDVTIKPVGVNDEDSTPVNKGVITQVKSNDGPSGIGTTVKAGLPQHGVVAVLPDGTIQYNPVGDYVGKDSYTYTLTTPDGVESDPIRVDITIYSASIVLTKVANNTGSKAGDVINYTLRVSNTGTTALTNVKVSDPGADAGSITPANIATLAAGTTTTVTARHTLTQADVDNRSYSNQASVTGTDAEGGKQITDDKSDDPITPGTDDPTVVTITPVGKISLQKTGTVTANYITYSFTITNTGDAVLRNITLTDSKLGLNNSTVDVPTGGLAPGQSIRVPDYKYTLTQEDREAGSVKNSASVKATDPVGNIIPGEASVDIQVPGPPTANNDAAQTQRNTPVVIDLAKNDNGGATGLDPASIEILTPPQHGKVEVGANGAITYTPDDGYTGTDQFTYRIKDLNGYYSNPAKVDVNINADAPFKIPTLFTPNGDGINDVFEIRGLDQAGNNTLSIVNRWGNEVYHATNYQNNWTGQGLNEGTYYYILQVRNSETGNWQTYKGYITLMRSLKR